MTILSEAFSLKEILKEIVDLVRPTAAVKNIDIRLAIPEALPTLFIGDPGRIRQILLNLLSSAIKFTDEGYVELRVLSLVTNKSGNQPLSLVRFEVIDTGIGISAADQNKLFKEFSQVEQYYTRRHGGTGLEACLPLQNGLSSL